MASHTDEIRSNRAALEAAVADLLQGRPEQLTPELARKVQLGAWCFWQAAPGSPQRAELGIDFAREWQKQTQRALALAPLFAAWEEAGLRAAAYKGWAMAWGVYPHPALRFAGDVDVLIDADDVPRARQLIPPGWELVNMHGPSAEDHAFLLFNAPLQLMVEMHIVLSNMACVGKAFDRRIVRAMLQDARCIEMRSADAVLGQCRVLQDTDLALALALNRAWSDLWQCKPHDYLDLLYLNQQRNVDEAAIAARSTALGLQRTWQHFTRLCSPAHQRFEMPTTPWRRARRWLLDWTVWHGGLSPRARQRVWLWRLRLQALARIVWSAPVLVGVIADLRSRPSPQAAAQVLPPRRRRGPPWAIWQIEQAARLGSRLLGPLRRLSGAGPCVVESLTLFRLLRQHGHAAQWCMGYRPDDGNGLGAHAWVECDDPLAFGLQAREHNARYRVTYRSPAV